MEAITVKNLRKRYPNGVEALKGVDLEIEQGDFFALLGPNGAGKTTLIGIVSGLVNKTEGQVQILRKDIDKVPEESRAAIGLVPQEFNFNIFETVFDIVVNQAGYYGIPRAKAEADAEPLLKQLGLWEKRRDQSRALSGGMKRRLMIARALIHHPSLLILDEPTAGVDIELRRGMWEFLTDLNKKGVTIILTTHYLEEAEQLCKHVAIINKGSIAIQGAMSDLLRRLEKESFIFYLKDPISPDSLKKFERVSVSLSDPMTLEVTLNEGERLNDFIGQLSNTGIEIQSMRNKSNRLEELFIALTGKESE